MSSQRVGVRSGGSPPTEAEGSGGGSGWVLLVTAPDQITAHLLRGRLEGESIEVSLDAFNPSPGAWMKPFGDPLAPVKVLVRRGDFTQASLLLHDVDVSPSGSPTSRRPRGALAITVAVAATAVLLVFLEVVDFAPCVLRMFCI